MKIPFKAALVGGRFRPPGDTVLQLLPAGAALVVQREPENPYDPNAISLRVANLAEEYPDIYTAAVEEMKEREQYDEEEGLPDPMHVGYVPRENAAMMVETIDGAIAREEPVTAVLIFSPSGSPMVEITAGI